jgi:hypothetical protein
MKMSYVKIMSDIYFADNNILKVKEEVEYTINKLSAKQPKMSLKLNQSSKAAVLNLLGSVDP